MASSSAGSSSSCPQPMAATSNGVWQGDHPTDFSLPLLILQIILVLFVTRLLGLLLKPLKQPRVIAEIIGGVLLGPSALGRSSSFRNTIFPKQSITVLETVADLGLLFFLFLVGLELDLEAIKKSGKKAFSIAAAGITLPFVMGVGVSVVLHQTIAKEGKFAPFLVFMGVALSITAFPVLARILAERRLLTTDVGQMAMSAAAINDVVAWVLLALAVALSGSGKSPLIALWVLLCGVAYVAVIFLAVKPLMARIARQTVEQEPVNEKYMAMTLAAVLVSGFATDAIGIHAIFGAFVLGLVIPKNGPFAGMLIEKIEDLVTILMLPLYFAVSGLKTNIGSIHGARAGGLLVLVISTACFGKIVGTFLVGYSSKMGFRKSLALGFLMNTKGLVELIVLNIGKDRKVLNDETFAIMVIMALFTTILTTPVVMWLYKPARNRVPYTHRTLYAPGDKVAEPELRLLACVQGMPNVHAIINLVEAVRGTRKRPLHMYILHLLQFSERPSSIMKVQRVRREGRPFWDNRHVNVYGNVEVAFQAFGELSKVAVRPMTAISRFDDMHVDICAAAEDKHVSIIILPFHKHVSSTSGVGWEGHSSGLRVVNQKVLRHAPCSVGILVDRGIGTASGSSSLVDQNIAVIFYGGADDREALAMGYRMAEHPGVRLSVFRFILQEPSEQHVALTVSQQQGSPSAMAALKQNSSNRFSLSSKYSGVLEIFEVAADVDWEVESKLDERCLAFAKVGSLKASNTSGYKDTAAATLSINYEERAISSPAEAAMAVGRMDNWSLLILGRGRRPSPLISSLVVGQQAEYPELGPIGAALTRAPLSEIKCSLLVVQQYDDTLVQAVTRTSKVTDISTSKSKGLVSPGLDVTTDPAGPSTDLAMTPESPRPPV